MKKEKQARRTNSGAASKVQSQTTAGVSPVPPTLDAELSERTNGITVEEFRELGKLMTRWGGQCEEMAKYMESQNLSDDCQKEEKFKPLAPAQESLSLHFDGARALGMDSNGWLIAVKTRNYHCGRMERLLKVYRAWVVQLERQIEFAKAGVSLSPAQLN